MKPLQPPTALLTRTPSRDRRAPAFVPTLRGPSRPTGGRRGWRDENKIADSITECRSCSLLDGLVSVVDDPYFLYCSRTLLLEAFSKVFLCVSE
jgi:hypothetical protein